MYTLTKDVIPGCVVWANKKIYYDKPGEKIDERRSMFLITTVNEDYFLGCPLTKNNSDRNRTILYKKHYPIKCDSRITEELFELKTDDIYSGRYFVISANTFEHFRRSLYQKIAIDQVISPRIYSDIFADDYVKDHYPKIDNIAVYPSDDKIFKYYYIYDEDEKNYFGVKLDRSSYDNYWVEDPSIQIIPKKVRFYDYYENSPISRNEVQKVLIK